MSKKSPLSFLVEIVIEGIFIQLIKVQKFSQRHIKRQRNLVQRLDPGVFGQPAHNIIQRRLLHIADNRQPVCGDSPRLAELTNAAYINCEYSIFFETSQILKFITLHYTYQLLWFTRFGYLCVFLLYNKVKFQNYGDYWNKIAIY